MCCHYVLDASAKGRVRNGRFASETAERRFQKRNAHLDPEAVKEPVGVGASAVESSIHNSFSSRKAGEMSAVIVMVIVEVIVIIVVIFRMLR